MSEHSALPWLRKELKKAQRHLELAKQKKGVTSKEVQDLQLKVYNITDAINTLEIMGDLQ